MDTIKAHIIYTGIISFVRTNDNEMVVLAPNGVLDPHHPHSCWLICDPTQIVEDPPPTLTPIPIKNQLSAFFISGAMSLGGIKSTPPRYWEAWRNKNECLVPLARLNTDPLASQLDTNLLADGHLDRVAFRTIIDTGEVDVSLIDPNYKWRFDHQAPADSRRLCQEVCHRVDTVGGTLSISFSISDENVGRQGIELKSNDPDQPILVMIGNTPLKDVFPPGPPDAPADDHHVKLYTKIAVNSQPNRLYPLIPTKVSDNDRWWALHPHDFPSANEARAQGANCPPGEWQNTQDEENDQGSAE